MLGVAISSLVSSTFVEQRLLKIWDSVTAENALIFSSEYTTGPKDRNWEVSRGIGWKSCFISYGKGKVNCD